MTFALVWLAMEGAGVVMQRRMYAYHFLPVIAPAALVFGFFPRLARPIPLAIALLPLTLLSVYAAGEVISIGYAGRLRLPVSDYLTLHAKPGDAVWIDDWPRLVIETDLRPGSHYPLTYLFTNYDNAGLDYADGIVGDFERVKPVYICLPQSVEARVRRQQEVIEELIYNPIRRRNFAEGWRRIQQYTVEHYQPEAVVGGSVVYHRRLEISAQTASVR